MQKIKEFFIQTYNFVRYEIWKITGNDELSRSRRVSYNIIKVIILAGRSFKEDKLNVRASALTYSLLLAVVPIIALTISVAKGFGLEGAIEDSLKGTQIDTLNLTPMVMNFVENYLATTQTGLFIGIGIVILLFSVTRFFIQAENAFNDIWQVKKNRSVIRRFTTYFSIILIVPILLILSSGLSIYISTVFTNSFLYEFLGPFIRVMVNFSLFVIVWLCFTISYMAIPNTQVKFKHALIAGIIAGTAFHAFQMLYVSGQISLSRYNAIYGGFVAVPLLLLWIRISCLIILFGAAISYGSQNIQNFDYEEDTNTISVRYRNFLYLYITYLIVHRFEAQEPPLTAEEISINNSLPSRLVSQLLSKMVAANVLIEVFCEENKTKSYQPAIDINQITAGLLFEKLETQGSEMFLSSSCPQMEKFWQSTLHLRECSKCEGDKMLIKDIG